MRYLELSLSLQILKLLRAHMMRCNKNSKSMELMIDGLHHKDTDQMLANKGWRVAHLVRGVPGRW